MTASAEPVLTVRHATLADLAGLLRDQHASKLDVVVPAGQIRATGGYLRIEGTGQAVLTPDGVDTGAGMFRPTGTCDAQVADKLGIPAGYLRRTREHHVDLYDVNVNTWLDAIVRYLVHPKEAGRVKTRLIKKLLAELNAAPDRVLFPKANAR